MNKHFLDIVSPQSKNIWVLSIILDHLITMEKGLNEIIKRHSVEKNNFEALSWYLKSARQGYCVAQYHLGVMYESGKGINKDYSEAFDWYHKAAKQRYAPAQNYLDQMYEDGRGVRHDDAEAFFWYHKAAEQGHVEAQYNLGSL